MITAPTTAITRPMSCSGRNGSCSRSTATVTANNGARLPSVEVMTGPSARFDAKVRSVSDAGKNRPMAVKIGRPRQTTGSPCRISGDSSRNSSVKEGTLIAAPESGSTVRNPSCAITTPAPRNAADAKANRMAAVMRSVCCLVRGAGSLVRRICRPPRPPCQSASGALALARSEIGRHARPWPGIHVLLLRCEQRRGWPGADKYT